MNNTEKIQQAILLGNSGSIVSLINEDLVAGHSARSIFDDSLLPGMSVVGERFKRNEMFLPQVLMSAQAMQTAIDILRPVLLADIDAVQRHKVIIGTVKGDMHDIGKNLVKIMLTGAGFEVIDLGVNVSANQFLETARKEQAKFVCLSALLSSTMNNMREVVSQFRTDEDLGDTHILIGGAPVSHDFAQEIGANGYAPTAPGAVELIQTLIQETA